MEAYLQSTNKSLVRLTLDLRLRLHTTTTVTTNTYESTRAKRNAQ